MVSFTCCRTTNLSVANQRLKPEISHFIVKFNSIYLTCFFASLKNVGGSFIRKRLILCIWLSSRGSSKKKKVPPLVAGPLRGGDGGKGRATKEKNTFFKTFFYFVAI